MFISLKSSKIILLLLVVLTACSTGQFENQHNLSVFRYNESKGITTLDPAHARNQTIIWPVSQLFNGLVQLNDSLKVTPAVAHSWDINNDGTQFTFHLRSDVVFHPSPIFADSTRRVTASDFVFSFNRILDPLLASPGRWVFEKLDPTNMYSAIDDTTLTINLEKPFPPFLSILAMPYCSVVPHEVVEQPGYDFAHHPIGTGPFLFKQWSPDEKLILRKNLNYFEEDANGEQLPKLDAISISFIKDKQSEFLEFLNGNLDFLSGVHPAYKDELLTRSGSLNPAYEDGFQLITQPYLNTEYLGILLLGDEGVSNPLLIKEVRQAINYGFDRQKMIKYLRNNLGYPATAGMIPNGLPGHISDTSGYSFNPDLARSLLSMAGFPGGEGIGTIKLTTTSDYLDLCEFIQFELGKIGLRIDISVSTGASFRNMVANSNLPFFRGSWIADYADAENYLALFLTKNHSPMGPNYTHFSSGEFDSLYAVAAGCADVEIRNGIYERMDKLVMEEAPVVPLFYDMVVRFVPDYVHGFTPNPMNSLVLKYVSLGDEAEEE
jgi:ABC-type transport system substrate-binding protein